MSVVLIVDYGLCNLDSVDRAVQENGGEPLVSDDPRDSSSADKIILPGVGNFAEAMRAMRDRRWDVALRAEVGGNGIPILGICLGMQLLASTSTEGGGAEGLGLVPGHVVKLQRTEQQEPIPHIGWNEVHQTRRHVLFDKVDDKKDFYFVHSYHSIPDENEHVLATTPYCGSLVSVVGRDHILGTQFHPEKSLGVGFQLLKNFLAM